MQGELRPFDIHPNFQALPTATPVSGTTVVPYAENLGKKKQLHRKSWQRTRGNPNLLSEFGQPQNLRKKYLL